MKIPLTITQRLTLLHLLVSALLIAIFSTAAYFLLSRGLHGVTVNPWEVHVAQLEESADTNIITGFSDIGQQEWDVEMHGVVKIRVYSARELLESASEGGTVTVDNFLIDKSALDELGLSEDDNVWFYTYFYEDVTDVIAVTKSTSDIAAALLSFQQVLLIIAPVALVISGILGYLYVKRALRPVQVITQTARDIEEGSLSKRLDIHSNDEIGRLASALNHMLARLEDAFDREIQFTADASHELRTPLAILQGEASLALEKDRSIEEYQKSLEAISQESARMSSLLKKMLFLARDSRKQLEFEEVNLKDFLTELVSDVEVLCEEKAIQCVLKAEGDLLVRGDRSSLRGLFLNLLNNAIRYTPSGGKISVTLARKGYSAGIAVKDTGVGIPKEHLKHIFKRFYRVDKSRSRSEGGAGLGLAICQRITEVHGGTIEVESKEGEGSTFSVLLPLVGKS